MAWKLSEYGLRYGDDIHHESDLQRQLADFGGCARRLVREVRIVHRVELGEESEIGCVNLGN